MYRIRKMIVMDRYLKNIIVLLDRWRIDCTKICDVLHRTNLEPVSAINPCCKAALYPARSIQQEEYPS